MIRRLPMTLGTLLTLASTTASADLVDMVWNDAGTFTHQTPIAAGKFVEVCGLLPAGLEVAWGFDASGPTDFNIHYHQGKEVVFPTKLSQVKQASDALRVKVKQDYCWMWTNRTAAEVELKLSFRR